MTADEYLYNLLGKYQVDGNTVKNVAIQNIVPKIQAWAGEYLIGVDISGSIAKGTANAGSNDMDLFISLSEHTPCTLHEIYDSLHTTALANWPARKQNVSIGINCGGYHFDLVPGKKQQAYQNWFSLWRNKAQTWTQTNITLQIQTIANSGRADEIRILKLWRTLANLDFPSFALELATLEALKGRKLGDLANNVSEALSWISANIETANLIDPANTNNFISADMTVAEKRVISQAAANARAKQYYHDFVW